MAEKPILFSTEMVQAILDGRKTQTRRVIRKQPVRYYNPWDFDSEAGERTYCPLRKVLIDLRESRGWGKAAAGELTPHDVKPPYQPGDILWVRETWCNINKPHIEPEYYYLADFINSAVEDYDSTEWKWKPSIHMPRSAARIFLLVTDVRVERVQEITKMGAAKEGMSAGISFYGHNVSPEEYPITMFKNLWNSLNAKRGYGWEQNPWVWVYVFERLKNYPGGDKRAHPQQIIVKSVSVGEPSGGQTE